MCAAAYTRLGCHLLQRGNGKSKIIGVPDVSHCNTRVFGTGYSASYSNGRASRNKLDSFVVVGMYSGACSDRWCIDGKGKAGNARHSRRVSFIF